jgi:hypothetical protein
VNLRTEPWVGGVKAHEVARQPSRAVRSAPPRTTLATSSALNSSVRTAGAMIAPLGVLVFNAARERLALAANLLRGLLQEWLAGKQ